MQPIEKAILTNTNTGDRVAVQFNPEEYTLSRSNNFAQTTVPGLAAPLLQFASGEMQTLEMELLLDTVEASDGSGAGDDVRELVARVSGMMDIDPDTHAPPVLLFTWASLSFTCLLARMSQRFVLFRADGRPLRARLQVTFNEYRNPELEARQVKRQTADYSKSHVVRGGETLSAIAERLYDDASLWRAIAIENGLDDPSRLPVGRDLLIPQLPYRDPETGELVH